MSQEIQAIAGRPLIPLPQGKSSTDVVVERHDLVFLFDAIKCNPNGDPDAGNVPRVQPDTLRGLVTDVCLKRKIRNFFSQYLPDGTPRAEGDTAQEGYAIFVRENAVFKDDHLDPAHQRAARRLLENLSLELVTGGFLTPADRAEVLDAIPETLPYPDKICGDVLKRFKDRFTFGSLPERLRAKITSEGDLARHIFDHLEGFSLAEADCKDESKAVKKIKDRCKPARGHTLAGRKADIDKLIEEALKSVSPEAAIKAAFAKESTEKQVRDALCAEFFDVRAFGAVVSTKGPLEGSFYGQIRGPIQLTFAESIDKIHQIDTGITRCAVASEEEKGEAEAQEEAKGGNRTMGRKQWADYGLYRCHIHFSPAFAAKTRFTYADLDNFLFALKHCLGDYNVDIAAARPGGSERGGMRVMGIIVFRHASALGNAPAHKLFHLVKIRAHKQMHNGANGEVRLDFVRENGEFGPFPQGIEDYYYEDRLPKDGQAMKYDAAKGRIELGEDTKSNGETTRSPDFPITMHRLVWEIPVARSQPSATSEHAA
jgi:CRISPR-associated protein Csd2